jgi:hypothetical protein
MPASNCLSSFEYVFAGNCCKLAEEVEKRTGKKAQVETLRKILKEAQNP